MIKMASGMDHGRVGPTTTTTTNDVVQYGGHPANTKSCSLVWNAIPALWYLFSLFMVVFPYMRWLHHYTRCLIHYIRYLVRYMWCIVYYRRCFFSSYAVLTAFYGVIFSLYAVLFLLCAVANSLYAVLFSRGYAKHRNDYLLGDRLCKCVTHSDVNFWPRTWRVWVWVSCRPPRLRAAILVLEVRFCESI